MLLIVGCTAPLVEAFVLPTLDGDWRIFLEGSDGSIAILVENGLIIRYDQGTGEFETIQEPGTISQTAGVVSFSLKAFQTFIDFNNGQPAEFIISGEGPVQADGTVQIFLSFSMVDGDAEGGLNAVMRRR